METNDTKRQFDQIVDGLVADYPSLANRRRPARRLVVVAAVVGGLAWGLLSMAMVAWGALGIALTVAVMALLATGIAVDSYRSPHR